MSRTLAVEVSNQAYAALEREASSTGASPEGLAAASIERQFGASGQTRTGAEAQAARERFERHFGELDLGHPTGVDNEQIEADLARKYADTHEGA